MIKDIKKHKRESEAIWPVEAMREETRMALHGRSEEEGAEEKQEEEKPYFPAYSIDKVIEALKKAKAEKTKIPLHIPQNRYTAQDVGRVILVPALRSDLEARLGYIAGVVEKVDGTDSGRLYVLLKKGDKLEKEKCWFYAKKINQQ